MSFWCRGRAGGETYVGEVDNGLPTLPTKDVEEREGEGVDRVVLAVVREPLLAPFGVLAPVSEQEKGQRLGGQGGRKPHWWGLLTQQAAKRTQKSAL